MNNQTRKHYTYGITRPEVETAVATDSLLSDFLNQYNKETSTYWQKAEGLVRFFKWLKIKKALTLSPAEFLDNHVKKRRSNSVIEKRWALNLALAYSRDNPDLKECADVYRRNEFFLPIKLFCDFYEEPLTTAKTPFKLSGKRKYKDNPFTIDGAEDPDKRIKTISIRKALTALQQRERTISISALQSGQSNHQVLYEISQQAEYIFEEIDAGKQRIRIDFPERKNNNFEYFSYISTDAIQEIQKYRIIRSKILKDLNKKSDHLFITEHGNPLTENHYLTRIRETWKNKGLYTGPYSVRPHCFRKFFEQEASPPERGISKPYIAFLMGHKNGGKLVRNALDAVGGVYDATPHITPSVVEKEYSKLEPYINIFSVPPTSILRADGERLNQKITVLETENTLLKKELSSESHRLRNEVIQEMFANPEMQEKITEIIKETMAKEKRKKNS